MTVTDLAGLAQVEANAPGAQVPVRFVQGDFGAGTTDMNGTLELRGRSTRLALQKSYKIHLGKDVASWQGQREINLNKHPFDLTRVRNRLAFDLFRDVPHFTSLRTHFVHLRINGEDRGLFTWVEEPDKHFLEHHGLDPDGTLYKAETFTFWPLTADVENDPVKLNLLIEAKANPDPDKLLRMLHAVNAPNRNINDVVAKYFDRDNYITWLAVNMLVGNFDTRGSNFYLYSPKGCDTWYFLPWDYDGSFGYYEQPGNPPRPRWRAGLANWWDSGLHQPFLADKQNLHDLEAMMAGLRATALSDAKVATLLASYRDVVRPYVAMPPDLWNLPVLPGTDPMESMPQYDEEYARLSGVVRGFEAEYAAVKERPMPVVLNAPMRGADLLFWWWPSYDFQGDPLTYDLELSTTPDFSDGTLVMQQTGMSGTMLHVPTPPPGEYFWHVISRDGKNPAQNWQISYVDSQMLEVD